MQLRRKWMAVRTNGGHVSAAAPNGSAPGPVGSGCSKCRIRAQDRRLGRPCSRELVARAHGGAPRQPDFQPRPSARTVGAPPALHPCPPRAPSACLILCNIAAQAVCPPVMPYLPRCGSLFAGGVFGVASRRSPVFVLLVREAGPLPKPSPASLSGTCMHSGSRSACRTELAATPPPPLRALCPRHSRVVRGVVDCQQQVACLPTFVAVTCLLLVRRSTVPKSGCSRRPGGMAGRPCHVRTEPTNKFGGVEGRRERAAWPCCEPVVLTTTTSPQLPPSLPSRILGGFPPVPASCLGREALSQWCSP